MSFPKPDQATLASQAVQMILVIVPVIQKMLAIPVVTRKKLIDRVKCHLSVKMRACESQIEDNCAMALP